MVKKFWHIIQRDGLWYTTKRVYAFAVARLPFGSQFSFSYYRGTRLAFTPSLLTYQIFANRSTRSTDVALFAQHLRPGDVCIDAGANIGSLTVAAAALVRPSGTVLAFEPSSKFFRITKRNVALNGFDDRVIVHQVALGAKADTVHLNETVNDDTTNHIANEGVPVSQAPLDAFTRDLQEIHLLKIDVEGYELEVLRGAPETLKKTERLLIEFIPSQLMRAGAAPEEVLEILQQDFNLFTLNKDQALTPFEYDAAETHHPDLICLKKS